MTVRPTATATSSTEAERHTLKDSGGFGRNWEGLPATTDVADMEVIDYFEVSALHSGGGILRLLAPELTA